MKENSLFILLSLFCLLFLEQTLFSVAPSNFNTISDKSKADQLMKNRSAQFIENKGQMTDTKKQPVPFVFYKTHSPGMDLYITDKGLTYVFFKAKENVSDEKDKNSIGNGEDENIKIEWNRIDMMIEGASIKKENISTEGQSTEFSQYFLSHCPNGISNVHSFQKIIVKEIYPNIDWVLYNSGEKGFKYDFVAHPGADYKQIELIYSSLNPLFLSSEGNIEIETEIGELTESKPISYLNGKEVHSQFERKLIQVNANGGYDSHITFLIPEVSFSLNSDLVIDPQLNWATFFGGSNFLEGSTSIALDASGNLFVAGYTVSTDFPTLDAGTFYQDSLALSNDVFILKFTNSGVLLWSTYYGGNIIDIANSIACDSFGNIFITGYTLSSDFPILDAGTYFQEDEISNDVFILKFDNLGNRLWATYYGGSYDDFGNSIAIDAFNNVFITGATASVDFPTQDAGTFFQGTFESEIYFNPDIFILKFDNLGNRLWATYYGGNVEDVGTSLDIDNSNNLYITGYSSSFDLPTQDAGAFFQSNNASDSYEYDSFILKFDNLGNRFWSTYYGGSASEFGYSIIVDGSNNIFLTGYTSSTNFPTQDAGTFFQGTNAGETDAYILKFDNLGNRLWSTYYGGDNFENLNSFSNLATDGCGNVYLSFGTSSSNILTQSTCDGGYFDNSFGGVSDIFITEFSASGSLIWATYISGSGADFRSPIAIDQNNSLFVSGEWTTQGIETIIDNSTYPLADPGGGAYFDPTYNDGLDDAFMIKFNKIPFSIDTSFTNASCDCTGIASVEDCPYYSYQWSDGQTTSTAINLCSGVYTIIVYDTATCSSLIDTIAIEQLSTPEVFLGNDTNFCEGSLLLDAQNSGLTYLWQDGSSNQTFEAIVTGEYFVVVDNGTCIASDTINITISDLLVDLGEDTIICIGDTLYLNAENIGATYVWQDGNNNQFFEVVNSGIYFVEVNNGVCTGTDTVQILISSIQVNLGSDLILCLGDFTEFNAQNLNSTYLWNTGYTGQILEVAEPDIYSVIVNNEFGCKNSDTISVQFVDKVNLGADVKFCEGDLIVLDGGKADQYIWSSGNDDRYFTVDQPGVYYVTVIYGACISSDTILVSGSEVNSALYVPNSFTPNGDGLNDLFAPVGEEITEFHLQIFSRWGEMVFESYDLEKRWNGSFNGEYLVQTGIYVYNLVYSTECSGAEKYEKQGTVNVIW